MDFKEAEKFLNEIKNICKKIPTKEKTFMEISGYPHYENVSSNILAFYLNPNEEHHLKNLVINTLLEVINNKNQSLNIDTSYFNIYREYSTIKGNRIDIVMQNEDGVIGIENKIDASVYNDLEDYAKTLNNLNKNSIKVLLSLHEQFKSINNNGFINITYSEFFRKLKENLRNYSNIDNKWYIYLVDFINSLEDFGVEKEMELEINEWINNHKDEIKDFKNLLNVAQNNINKKLNNFVRDFEEKSSIKMKYYNWEDSVGTTAYVVFNCGCNLDIGLSTDGWSLGIFVWKKSNLFKVKELLTKKQISYTEENGHLWIYKLNYDTPIENIKDKANEIYNLIKLI